MINPEVVQHIPDILTTIGTLGLLMAFTKNQREAILERDHNKCQFPEKHNCTPDNQVHHIIPQRYCAEVGIENPDFPENGITLCKNVHVGEIRPGVPGVHPDVIEARKHYKRGGQSFKDMFEARQKKLQDKKPYWNTTWDRLFHVIAIKNTQLAEKAGWVFPVKHVRSKVA